MSTIVRRTVPAILLAGALMMGTTGCLAGENASAEPNEDAASSETQEWSTDTLSLDFATYNPLSLVVRDQGFIEEALGDDVTVEWVQSAGSNKANEFLRAGSIDVGSTAGSAALLARANG
ncbi:MAG: aliphatic sulfonates ABC transporter substrate-binding protein, partial [Microbacterium sp.]